MQNKIIAKKPWKSKSHLTIDTDILMIIVQWIGRLIHIFKGANRRPSKNKSITMEQKKQQNRLKPLTNEFFFVFLQQFINYNN